MFTTIVALGTILLQIGIIVLIIGWVTKAPFVSFVARHSSRILIFIFAGGALISMVYQYGFGYEPCLLCWYQRIPIFSAAIILFTGNIRKSRMLANQVLILSVIGFAIALLHNYIDIFPTGLDVCGATGPSCLARYVYEFGYITIPMMSGTVLLSGIILTILAKRYPQSDVVDTAK